MNITTDLQRTHSYHVNQREDVNTIQKYQKPK